jgi:hypothetical protein
LPYCMVTAQGDKASKPGHRVRRLNSAFGLRASFGLRPSGFGLRIRHSGFQGSLSARTALSPISFRMFTP